MQQVPGADFGFFQHRKVAWDTELSICLKRFKPYLFMAKVAGLNDHLHRLQEAQVSSLQKSWTRLLGIAAVATSAQSVLSLLVPSLVPSVYILFGKDFRFFFPLLSATMMVLRLRTAFLLTDDAYLKEIRQVLRGIMNDPVLKVIRIDTRKLKAMFALASCSVFVSPIGIAFSQLALDPESWKLLNFYAVVLGCALYTSAFTFIFAYVTGLSFFVVLPLLKISTRKFETATETLDLATLHGAIRCHDTCCRLVACMDRIASHFFGSALILAVPNAAIIFSNLGEISRSPLASFQIALPFSGFLVAMMVILCLAAAIHQEAQKPEGILSDHICENRPFERLSYQFTKRFRHRSFGYTFFGIFTFTKQTILSVLNIITTYLIVALQFRDAR